MAPVGATVQQEVFGEEEPRLSISARVYHKQQAEGCGVSVQSI